jgi:hypothetical protein
MKNELAFYREQSVFTDPKSNSHLYSDLPQDVQGLASVVQGLLLQPYKLVIKWYEVNPDDVDCDDVFGIRKGEEFLDRIHRMNSDSLVIPRPPSKRLGVICRNFAVLHVSMLRNAGIPARERVGFAGYLDDPKRTWWEHRITQFWNEKEKRWILGDAMMDDIQKKARKIEFNTLDIRQENSFLLAGEVWSGCRSGKLEPMRFGDSETDLGMPPIRYALLHDFAALNKFELLGNDDWGELIRKKESDLTKYDLELLDKIARVTIDPDRNFDELCELFEQSTYGKDVRDHPI